MARITMEIGAVIQHDIRKSPKTGEWRHMKPAVDKEKCAGCGACVSYCPEAAINLDARNPQPETQKEKSDYKLQGTGYANIDYDFCKGCGVCADVCPAKAIIMKKN